MLVNDAFTITRGGCEMSTPQPRKRIRSNDAFLQHMMQVQEKNPWDAATPHTIGPVEDLGNGALSSGMTQDESLALDLAQAVKEEVHRMRVREQARAAFNAQAREPIPRPYTFAEYASLPRPSDPYRIDNLLRAGGRVILSAPAKAGKSTMRDHLTQALVTGDAFLGEFHTTPATGNVVVLDFENSRIESQDRIGKLGGLDRAVFWELIGKASSFNILDKACRQEWAAALVEQQTSVLVVDTMSTVLEGLGLDENREIRKFLVPLDALKEEAGIGEVAVMHHFGYSAVRSRGDSFVQGWPDAEWLILWDGDAEHPRYFKTGVMRNGFVVPKRELLLDQATRRLTLGSQRGEARPPRDDLQAAILDVVNETPGLNASNIKDRLRPGGFTDKAVDAALRSMTDADLIYRMKKPRDPNARNAWFHYPVSQEDGETGGRHA